jgi:asparagine synthetase B (glutamine-hydrolysing)
MCGIVATLTDPRSVDSPALTSTITAMNSALKHRGPDDDGHVVSTRLAAAVGWLATHERLAT